jgi:two-component system, NarL family, sensor kinase
VALLVVSVASWFAANRAAEREAVEDARQRTITLAGSVVGPALTDAVVAGDPAALAAFDVIVRERVLSDAVVRVKLWSRDGTIVYSDEPRLIGARYGLDEEELEVLDRGLDAVAESSDLERPENRFDTGHGPLLEVYLPVWASDGQPLLFETYQTRSAVAAHGSEVLMEFLPITFGGLALLLAVLVPTAVSLARRLDQARAEREKLLRHALDASTTERRRIAAHLHDGMVQSLAGSSFALSGVADSLAAQQQTWASDVVRDAAAEMRQGVRGLRSLLVEIYPPGLRRAGLATALSDLTAQLSSRGIAVDVEIDDVALPERVENALFRVAQEAIRNIVKHADASSVRLRMAADGTGVTLVVADDGRGFVLPDAARPSSATPDGHLGLGLLEDAVHEVGGALTVTASPDAGTVLVARIPLR